MRGDVKEDAGWIDEITEETAAGKMKIGEETAARKMKIGEETAEKIEQDVVVADLLANVVSQLHTVQVNIRACQEDTLDSGVSGVDTSDKLDRVDDELASIISEVISIQQGKKEQFKLNSDNTNSIMENITLALSTLELNVNKERVLSRAGDGTKSPVSLSEDDSLERMVDQLFKNVRSLKSILVEEEVTDPDVALSDDSEQLSKLIEHLSNSITNTRSHHLSSEDGSPNGHQLDSDQDHMMSMDCGSVGIGASESIDNYEEVESSELESLDEGMVSQDMIMESQDESSSQEGDTGSHDDSMRDGEEGWDGEERWTRGGRQTYDSHENLDTDRIFGKEEESYNFSGNEETHDLFSEAESPGDTERSVSTSLEYGYIPVNYTIVGNISQCKTPTPTSSLCSGEQIISVPRIPYNFASSGDSQDEPRHYRIQRLESDDVSLVSCDLSSCDDYHATDNDHPEVGLEVYKNLALLPQLPVPLKRSKKDVIDIYNKINRDMNSLTRMVEPESTTTSYTNSTYSDHLSSDRRNMYNVAKMLSDGSLKLTDSRNNSAEKLLRGIKNETKEVSRLLAINTSDEISGLSSHPGMQSGNLLSDIRKEAVETQKMLDIYNSDDIIDNKTCSSTSAIISAAMEETEKTDEQVDEEFLELMKSVNRANKRIERLRKDPTVQISPGEIIQDEAEWDDFTPILETPPVSRNTNRRVTEPASEAESESTYHSSRSSFTQGDSEQSPQPSLPRSSQHSSSEADREVKLIMEDYTDSENSIRVSDPEDWPVVKGGLEVLSDDHLAVSTYTDVVVSAPDIAMAKPREVATKKQKVDRKVPKSKRKLDMSDLEAKPSVEELIKTVQVNNSSEHDSNKDNSNDSSSSSKASLSKNSLKTSTKSSTVNKSVKSEEFSTLSSVTKKSSKTNGVEAPPEEDPKPKKEELPDFLKLFVKRGDTMEDYVPNTTLLNALLANSGLTIKPITQKVDVSVHSKCQEETSDRTSKMSDNKSYSSLEEDGKAVSDKEPSKSVSWVTGSRPPKLENLTKEKPQLSKSVSSSTESPVKSHSRSLREAMGGTSDRSLSEHSSKSSKPKILLNSKPQKRAPKPEQIYNVPKPEPPIKVLTFDTWTCTDPPPKKEEKGVETLSVQTEDRALSPIVTMEFPKIKKLKKSKKSKTPNSSISAAPQKEQPPPPTFTPPPPPSISVTEVPKLTAPNRLAPGQKPGGNPSKWNYDGTDIPELSDYRDKSLPSDEDKSDRTQKTSISEKHQSDKLPSIKEEEDDTISSGDDSASSEDETSGVVIQVKGRNCAKKDKLKEDLNKALLEALKGKSKINPAALRGLKEQILRQSNELEGARNRLANAGSRVRSMAQMFNMDRQSDTPLGDYM
ncbi:hypothetical protein ACHWQZ_G008424 [Mnemiopsis leidyi]